MSFRKVLILVEGQTEERFIKDVLQTAMPSGLTLQPIIVSTKRFNAGGKFKGGVPSYTRVRGEITRLLADSSAILVTTMLDYYGLPATFPGRHSPQGKTALDRVRFVEEAWAIDINNRRFLPYLSLHEFEALLFSEPTAIADGFSKPELATELNSIRASYPNPEEINDHPTTTPSARLKQIFGSYSKPLFGSRIAQKISIKTMTTHCPHFANWVSTLQNLTVAS